MAKLVFDDSEIMSARRAGLVLFGFRLYSNTSLGQWDDNEGGLLTEDQADELTKAVRAKLKKFKAAAANAGA